MTTETNVERLEDIKRIQADHLVREDGTAAIAVTELKFLVNQAERAQELDELNNSLSEESRLNFQSASRFKRENARLREAIKQLSNSIEDDLADWIHPFGRTVIKNRLEHALKGESE